MAEFKKLGTKTANKIRHLWRNCEHNKRQRRKQIKRSLLTEKKFNILFSKVSFLLNFCWIIVQIMAIDCFINFASYIKGRTQIGGVWEQGVWGQYLDLRGRKWQERTDYRDELHNLYSSPNIIMVVKSQRMRWVGLVARIRENSYKNFGKKPWRKEVSYKTPVYMGALDSSGSCQGPAALSWTR
jgi:hypothetical protein